MPDLNHSNKGTHVFRFGEDVSPAAQGKGLVTFGARNVKESLPFSMELSEQ
jgi:hypothetical protein